ncbi:MAG TPA: SIS domain-containing protein [Burkholderiales bacterium]|nr:SIS domain-containing protein [Burkholderiales bacterium]
MNTVDRIFASAGAGESFAAGYLEYCNKLLSSLDTGAVARMIDEIVSARARDSQIFFIGNGGSASTASHFANDVAIGTRCPWKPFRAIALTDNAAIMTAIANDDGYEQVFVKQLEALMKPRDVVVAITASGNSPNLVKAFEFVRAHKGIGIALTGFDGGRLAQMADIDVQVTTPKGEYGPVEAVHGVLLHLVGNYLIQVVRGETQQASRTNPAVAAVSGS